MFGPFVVAIALGLDFPSSQVEPAIIRDSYGVPMIRANNTTEAYRLMGKAVAEDRLWQMEMSRRNARGQMAEVLGSNYVASDESALAKSYTDSEYKQLISQLPQDIQANWNAYVAGINETIKARIATNTLPEQYAQFGFEPREWTATDSAAIGVGLARQFGQGGAGEIRNYALIQYLRTRPAAKEKLLDVLDDLAWQNDPRAPVTVSKRDDPTLREPQIFNFTRAESETQLAALPPTNLLELARGVRTASNEAQELVAEANAVPYKVGSYAIAVSPRRSGTGKPMLLSAPQMGHTTPSIVHEVAVDSPDLKVAGMDVPGIPGVLIGYSPFAAWGFTSGVADLEDIFVSRLTEGDKYMSQGEERTLEKITFNIKVKGQSDKEFVQYRTTHGPVLLRSNGSKAVYSLRSAFWKREISTIASMNGLYSAKTSSDFTVVSQGMPVSFNLFFATKTGDIGYRYCGLMPLRAKGVDPRMPTLDEKEFQWLGFVSSSNMPRTDNPDSGVITNWNNKPVAWWPNGDTPVWGRLFRNQVLNQAIPEGKLTSFDLEKAAWTIARRETDTSLEFQPWIRRAIQALPNTEPDRTALDQLAAFDGWNVEGSIGATLYANTVSELRNLMFALPLGNFTADNLFRQVIQPHVILEALDQKTNLNFIPEGQTPLSTVQTAIRSAIAITKKQRSEVIANWGFRPGSIQIPGEDAVPYINRGTYIQITELAGWTFARSVASPGVTETGKNSRDQVPLARSWQFKTMWGWQ